MDRLSSPEPAGERAGYNRLHHLYNFFPENPGSRVAFIGGGKPEHSTRQLVDRRILPEIHIHIPGSLDMQPMHFMAHPSLTRELLQQNRRLTEIILRLLHERGVDRFPRARSHDESLPHFPGVGPDGKLPGRPPEKIPMPKPSPEPERIPPPTEAAAPERIPAPHAAEKVTPPSGKGWEIRRDGASEELKEIRFEDLKKGRIYKDDTGRWCREIEGKTEPLKNVSTDTKGNVQIEYDRTEGVVRESFRASGEKQMTLKDKNIEHTVTADAAGKITKVVKDDGINVSTYTVHPRQPLLWFVSKNDGEPRPLWGRFELTDEAIRFKPFEFRLPRRATA